MGADCCAGGYDIKAEEFVISITKEKALRIKDYDYNRLLNEIVSKRVQQEVYKIHIDEYLIPDFYNKNLPITQTIYQKSMLEHLSTCLEEKNNMYVVMLLFYPYINHKNEDTCETFFSMFSYVSQNLTIQDLEFWMIKYFTWVTTELTKGVMIPCKDKKLRNSLDDLVHLVYTESAIRGAVDKLLSNLKKNAVKTIDKEKVTKEMFKEMYDKNPFAKVEEARAIIASYH
jgi:hypothetical protein